MARPAALVTTASRLKAIVGQVERARSTQAKEELLAELSLPIESLADETRPLALSTLLAALDWLAAREGEGALLRLTEDLLADDALGVFAPLLRAHERLEDALGHVHLLVPSLPPIETLSVDKRRCRLRFRSLGIENEKLLRLAHAAELAAICRLYGFDETHVDLRDDGTLVLRWRQRQRERLALVALIPSPAFFAISFRTGLFVTIAALATLAFAHRERAHRIESRAQRHRIRVLERGLALSRGLPKSASTEGSLVAGEYRLGPLLGIGANGAVHRAVRISDGTEVAIKLLRHAAAHDELAADRLRREAEALALSRHPNVVELYDHGLVERGVAYLVLELLDGGEPLSELIAREGPLAPEMLLPLALGICDALVAMHAAGVIHRDVKPSNVFVGVREGEPFLKLFDFGLAHIEWAETRLTEPGRPIGTPGYRSPEQAEGRSADARSDIYAFGVLLRECLTGQRPDEGEPDLPSVARRWSGVEWTAHPLPSGFRELIERATALDPNDRFPDARTLRRALLSIEPTLLRKAQ